MSRAWRRRQQWLEEQKISTDDQDILTEVFDSRGLLHILSQKPGLERYLQQLQKQPVIVGVEKKEDTWVYVVRGIRPPISYWEGYEIWFPRLGSGNLWSPTTPLSQAIGG